MIDIKIALASKSPRRKFLLEEAAFNFRVITQDTDEYYDENMPVSQIAQYLSGLKAKSVLDLIHPDELIIAADTIVISTQNEVLGKPANSDDAAEMLAKLSGTQHDVITGVTLLNPQKETAFSVTSTVDFDVLTPKEISFYIDNYKPYDKAGSYGIQDWIGWCKIKSIRGSYSNIMGLPMNALYNTLITF